jgi:hypothetical protein
VIIYEWHNPDEGASYRMAVGKDAQHPMHPGQVWELQRSVGRVYWIAMVDYNAGVREPRAYRGEVK